MSVNWALKSSVFTLRILIHFHVERSESYYLKRKYKKY